MEEVEVRDHDDIEPRSLKERLAALVPWLRDAAMSHQDLNSKLSKALKASVPGYSYIEYVYLDNTVVYSVRSGYDGAVSVDVAPSSSNLFRRSFMVETDGSVTLGDDVEAVEIVMSVEPKTAEAPVTEAAPAADNPAALEGGKEEQMEPTPEKAALIKALVECPCSGFTSDDAKALEAFSDERLLAFKAAGAARKAQEDAAKTPKTLEQYLADAPDEIRTLVADKKAQDAVRTASLVTALKAAQTEYTEEELTKMDIKTLERLSKIVKTEPAPDFSGRGLAAQDNADKSTYAAPDSYQASLQKK